MTQENKHTPAPWKIVAGKKSDEIFIESDTRKGGRICRLWNGRTDINGNAHLIAAAPDMYDALENIIKSELFKKLSVGQRDSAIRATMKARGQS